jgi:hypothetical protein
MTPTIDLSAENPLSLSTAARQLPALRNGRPVHAATLLRWVVAGIRGPGGGRVRLEAVRVGGRWVTTVQALERFQAALSVVPGAEALPTPRSPAQRQRAAERAGQELKAMGI